MRYQNIWGDITMKVKCVDDLNKEIFLTKDKCYPLLGEHANRVTILDDLEQPHSFSKNRFKKITIPDMPIVREVGYVEDLKMATAIKQAENQFDKLGQYNYRNISITPFDYIKANNLNFFEGNVIECITRWKEKNSIEDLERAIIYLQELIKQSKERQGGLIE